MKTKYFALVLFLLPFSAVCQEKAALNPEFLEYEQLHDKKAGRESIAGKVTGYIPSPLYLHFKPEHELPGGKKSAQSLPSYFDLRDEHCVTSVKNQNPLGSCWTFASIGAIESSWIKKGLALQTIDLSEENMGTCHGFEFGINEGGNDLIAAAYLTRLSGPVTEASDPYTANANATCPSTVLPKPAYVPTVDWLPKDITRIKEAVYNYGAVTASITSGGFPSSYYNSSNHTFYYNGTTSPDHAVLIVGWDDNKVVTGGYSSPGPVTGAWIVKNSWGTGWGESGYFYVAYEDSKFLSSAAVFPSRIEVNEVDTLYMEDKLGATSSFGYRDETAYGLVKYSAPSKNFIDKVGSYINSSGSFVDIEIYDDFTGDSLLENLLASSYNNLVKYPGYSTFDIRAIVEGDFYIKLKYYTPGYNYPIPAESAILLAGEPYADPDLHPEGRFWISKTGEKWKAIGSNVENNEADLCIRAYANRNTTLNAFFTADRKVACLGTSVEFTENSNGHVSGYLWNFGQGATPATASTAGPHTVVYNSPGLKDVSLTITGPGGTRVLTRNDYVNVVEELDIFLPYSEMLLPRGKSTVLTASGADSYSWSPTTGLSSTEGASVTASPEDTIIYTVTGYSGTCTGSNQVKINVVEGPSNDDACNAIEITASGFIGHFSNKYASAEGGEPYAPEAEDGCERDMYWCVEGGIQNSIWFTFTGPENGIISVDAPGMDNQLAVYRADHCDSLFSTDGYEMVAAYDDYYPVGEKYAAAIERVDVVPGARYFLQVDGSAGGAEGEFDLYLYNYPLGIREEKIIEKMEGMLVYPNPGKGSFELVLPQKTSSDVKIRLTDLSGKTVHSEILTLTGDNKVRLGLEGINPGLYLLQLKTRDRIFVNKLIIE